MAPERGTAIAKSDFPMYIVNVLDERHFLVAGGGGQSKTGVSNALVRVCYIKISQKTHIQMFRTFFVLNVVRNVVPF